MFENKKRETAEQVAHRKAMLMGLTIFATLGIVEVLVLLGKENRIEIIIVAIAVPILSALFIYLRFKELRLEEEKFKRQVEHIQDEIAQERFAQIELEEPTSSLYEKVDLVAVPSEEEGKVIVAMSHNEEIIPVQVLPVEQFEEQYNILEGQDKN